MIPVKQNKLYQADALDRGNCLTACLASLFELPLWMVPPFEDMEDVWRIRINEWATRFFSQTMIRVEGHPIDELPEFYIANGKSQRGVWHSTIYSKGKLVHDPHYSNTGIIDVTWCWYFEPVLNEGESNEPSTIPVPPSEVE